MQALEFRIQVNPRQHGVELTWVTPDGEVQVLGNVATPSHLPMVMSQVAAYVALELVNAVWEVRAG